MAVVETKSSDRVSQTEVFQKFLICEMQLELVKYFSGEGSESQEEDETIGSDAKTLCQLKELAADAESEVIKKFAELAEVLTVVEKDINEQELCDARKFFGMKSEVEQLEAKLQTFIAKYGADLDSSIAVCNDEAEELVKVRNECEELKLQNDALKLRLLELTENLALLPD